MRIAMGLSYVGSAFHGWQSQPDVANVQDTLELALTRFVALDSPIHTLCAGRTDTGVHALHQVVHFDSPVQRDEFAWVRGTNTFLPPTVAVHWARESTTIFMREIWRVGVDIATCCLNLWFALRWSTHAWVGPFKP